MLRTHFTGTMTWNNSKIIAEKKTYISDDTLVVGTSSLFRLPEFEITTVKPSLQVKLVGHTVSFGYRFLNLNVQVQK